MMKSIPVLGIPILNRGDLLLRLFNSLDYPIDQLVIVNNGEDSSVQDAIDKISQQCSELILHKPRNNLGVAGSWNWIIKQTSAQWCLLVNSDMTFHPNTLQFLARTIWDNYLHSGLIHCTPVEQPQNGYSLFSISQWLYDKVGSFDENFYPAYMEDCDYNYRCKLSGLQGQIIENVNVIHGEEPFWGSTTIHSNPHFLKMNQVTHRNNFRYYLEKWGGEPAKEVYLRPFNQPQYDINFWQLNPDLRRVNQIW